MIENNIQDVIGSASNRVWFRNRLLFSNRPWFRRPCRNRSLACSLVRPEAKEACEVGCGEGCGTQQRLPEPDTVTDPARINI